MDINWQVRINNPIWWAQVFLAIVSPILAYYGMNFKDFTTWDSVFSLIGSALKNPYVLGLIVVNVINTINDPTTKGVSDSKRALEYVVPN
ncbi:phage holin family protein [bacterium]|nr:phage holin family protein [bacterium]